MEELRCDGKLHGILKGKFLEVKCGSRRCGAKQGVTVFHLFHTESGALLSTTKKREEGKTPE
ncbi:hypothetical protein BI084_gp18 [Gordonia phage Terapin]|uniref:Uncharacterized protein n=5 Tax=Terapinvirus terapin TaxID=2734283 RepID=A0A345MB58_9CAUD|nr:hypothetical protein BI084_gp18 [Gordonia phage Terapin]AVP43295.1 hypothetical protein PBI_DJOKOVIC_18 [Gordonia phage Djokovic]AXH67729.1 hypothetical protein SEA_BEYONCAGE_18 [Gordonia phage Beyoncage]QOC56163.1 hypothetical protein SEA_SIENNA_18 [Gordonia phage Sienna]QOC56588.1 hypothetical protein SEA_BITESIZE_18 [Gordonia phage BiteSize]QYW00821.1 hypothetical protein SEA_MADI_18 [Gordonia phage Madi]